MTWILVTVYAALMQAIRTAGQKQLGVTAHPIVVAWVRFLFGLPLAIALYGFWFGFGGLAVVISGQYGLYVLGAAFAQFVGSIFAAMVLLRRNFAVGTVLIKTETLFVVVLGYFILSESLSLWMGLALLIGMAGIALIAFDKGGLTLRHFLSHLDSTSAFLGLSAGLFFGFAAVFIRLANLSLDHLASAFQQGLLTLMFSLAIQTLLGAMVFCYLCQKNPAVRSQIGDHLKACVFIGVTSMLGSFGWYTAYALNDVAPVKILAHIEVVFAIVITWWYFRDRISPLEYWGIVLVVASTLLVVAL